jgi:hypothetical protein
MLEANERRYEFELKLVRSSFYRGRGFLSCVLDETGTFGLITILPGLESGGAIQSHHRIAPMTVYSDCYPCSVWSARDVLPCIFFGLIFSFLYCTLGHASIYGTIFFSFLFSIAVSHTSQGSISFSPIHMLAESKPPSSWSIRFPYPEMSIPASRTGFPRRSRSSSSNDFLSSSITIVPSVAKGWLGGSGVACRFPFSTTTATAVQITTLQCHDHRYSHGNNHAEEDKQSCKNVDTFRRYGHAVRCRRRRRIHSYHHRFRFRFAFVVVEQPVYKSPKWKWKRKKSPGSKEEMDNDHGYEEQDKW